MGLEASYIMFMTASRSVIRAITVRSPMQVTSGWPGWMRGAGKHIRDDPRRVWYGAMYNSTSCDGTRRHPSARRCSKPLERFSLPDGNVPRSKQRGPTLCRAESWMKKRLHVLECAQCSTLHVVVQLPTLLVSRVGGKHDPGIGTDLQPGAYCNMRNDDCHTLIFTSLPLG